MELSGHYGEVQEDALQKGLSLPDEAALRKRVLRKNVEVPDLATVKDFLQFHAAMSKGKIKEKLTFDSLNSFAEWFFARFSRATDTPTKVIRTKPYDTSQDKIALRILTRTVI
jgi:hypothetical protein